jgi:hypothetical protein
MILQIYPKRKSLKIQPINTIKISVLDFSQHQLIN